MSNNGPRYQAALWQPGRHRHDHEAYVEDTLSPAAGGSWNSIVCESDFETAKLIALALNRHSQQENGGAA